MSDLRIRVEAFGDPACPYDWSAEPARLRLRWRYGGALDWHHRMVGLSLTRDDYPARGVTLPQLAESRADIAARYGMPIDATLATRHVATAVACRAVVAVRRVAPERVDAFLRHLRVLVLSMRRVVDEPETLAEAAEMAGIAQSDLDAWTADPRTDEDLARDMAAARAPDPPSLALPERLAADHPGGGPRLTCPSYVMTGDGGRLSAPGFQPARVYEVMVANLAPALAPRPDADDAAAVLDWAPYPLATQDVAAVMGTSREAARDALRGAGARFTPAGTDGFWDAG